jgi:hypothetical protein
MTFEDFTKIAEGWTSELYSVSLDRVLKLYKRGWERLATVEFAKMHYLQEYLTNVPRVFEVVEHLGRKGYVMQRLDAVPLGRSGVDSAEMARTLSEAMLTYSGVATNDLFESIGENIRKRIVANAGVLGDTGRVALAFLDGLPSVSNLCHGDFHSGNVLVGRGGTFIIDWNGSGRADPNADIAKALIIMLFAPAAVPALSEKAHSDRRAICREFVGHLAGSALLEPDRLSKWLFVRMVEFLLLPLPQMHREFRRFVERWTESGAPNYEEVLA